MTPLNTNLRYGLGWGFTLPSGQRLHGTKLQAPYASKEFEMDTARRLNANVGPGTHWVIDETGTRYDPDTGEELTPMNPLDNLRSWESYRLLGLRFNWHGRRTLPHMRRYHERRIQEIIADLRVIRSQMIRLQPVAPNPQHQDRTP